MKNKEYEAIYKRYLKEALNIDRVGHRILKADCSNEFHGHPKSGCFCLTIGGIVPLMEADVVCLEIDKELVQKTQALYPELNIVIGDIRAIPFGDKVFDTVLDFSTLDHVPFEDSEQILKEYHRVLKNDNQMILVTWCVEGEKNQEKDEVYYFAKDPLRKLIKKYFKIGHEEVIHEETGLHYLTLWRCHKNGEK